MAGPSWEAVSPFLPLLHRASLSLCLNLFILPPTASCPHPSFLPGPVYSGSRHSHFAIFPLGRRLSLPRRPGVCGPGSQSLQVSRKTQPDPLPSASGRRRQSGGGILGHLSGPSSQVSWRWGYSTRGEGAYPGPPAPTCICPTIRSPGAVGPAAGEDQLRTALQFSLPSFPRFGRRGDHIPTSPAGPWGRVGRNCGAGQEAGLGLSTEMFPFQGAFTLFSLPPSGPSALPSFLNTSGRGTAQTRTLRALEGPRSPLRPILLVQNYAQERACLADALAQPPQTGLRRMRVLFTIAEPVRKQRRPPENKREKG